VRVFISWSGEPSRSIARALATWLSGLIQAVEPWMSDEEIGSGERWRDEIGTALDKTDFGIVCLTLANQRAPWLMFESGALAKHLRSARLIPLCIDLEPTDVSSPLSDWQARKLNREDMWKVVQDINGATPKPLTPEVLTKLFDLMWPGFEQEVTKAKEKTPEPQESRRSSEDMLQELVDRVRRIERTQEAEVREASIQRLRDRLGDFRSSQTAWTATAQQDFDETPPDNRP
jgi:TIR domain